MEPLYKVRGGLWLGKNFLFSLKISWPWAELRIHQDKVELRYFHIGKFVFAKHQIKRFERYKGVFVDGIKIIHNKPNTSPNLIFWVGRPEKTLEKLKELGYKVTLNP